MAGPGRSTTHRGDTTANPAAALTAATETALRKGVGDTVDGTLSLIMAAGLGQEQMDAQQAVAMGAVPDSDFNRQFQNLTPADVAIHGTVEGTLAAAVTVTVGGDLKTNFADQIARTDRLVAGNPGAAFVGEYAPLVLGVAVAGKTIVTKLPQIGKALAEDGPAFFSRLFPNAAKDSEKGLAVRPPKPAASPAKPPEMPTSVASDAPPPAQPVVDQPVVYQATVPQPLNGIAPKSYSLRPNVLAQARAKFSTQFANRLSSDWNILSKQEIDEGLSSFSFNNNVPHDALRKALVEGDQKAIKALEEQFEKKVAEKTAPTSATPQPTANTPPFPAQKGIPGGISWFNEVDIRQFAKSLSDRSYETMKKNNPGAYNEMLVKVADRINSFDPLGKTRLSKTTMEAVVKAEDLSVKVSDAQFSRLLGKDGWIRLLDNNGSGNIDAGLKSELEKMYSNGRSALVKDKSTGDWYVKSADGSRPLATPEQRYNPLNRLEWLEGQDPSDIEALRKAYTDKLLPTTLRSFKQTLGKVVNIHPLVSLATKGLNAIRVTLEYASLPTITVPIKVVLAASRKLDLIMPSKVAWTLRGSTVAAGIGAAALAPSLVNDKLQGYPETYANVVKFNVGLLAAGLEKSNLAALDPFGYMDSMLLSPLPPLRQFALSAIPYFGTWPGIAGVMADKMYADIDKLEKSPFDTTADINRLKEGWAAIPKAYNPATDEVARSVHASNSYFLTALRSIAGGFGSFAGQSQYTNFLDLGQSIPAMLRTPGPLRSSTLDWTNEIMGWGDFRSDALKGIAEYNEKIANPGSTVPYTPGVAQLLDAQTNLLNSGWRSVNGIGVTKTEPVPSTSTTTRPAELTKTEPSSVPSATTQAKVPVSNDAYDALSNDRVLGAFKSIDPSFKEITHSDGSEAVKLCTYRTALRLMGNSGYSKEGALRAAAPSCIVKAESSPTAPAPQ